jgi:RHH-type proline utilization regulon transcriptional repressor/proline dehydrogenase/delta 1-pyrroline-5-carboxylate dehydrogenase
MSTLRDRLPHPIHDEATLARQWASELQDRLDWRGVLALSRPWVDAVRAHPAPFWALETLLREYPISQPEGLALMRLAEALLRIPDTDTAVALTADQLGRTHFDHVPLRGAHPLPIQLAGQALEWTKKLLPHAGGEAQGLWSRLGGQTVVAATVRAIQLMGQQFVLAETIEAALKRAHEHPNTLYSFDMLGEAARSDADALRYFEAYRTAIATIARHEAGRDNARPEHRHGLSVKLSALDARYEPQQAERVFDQLLPRLLTLVDEAAAARLNLTLDAEESDRLELSLAVFERVAEHVQRQHASWDGLGLAVQAYQTRAPAVIDWLDRLTRRTGLRLMVRLVKGAYWDSEVKRAQELGLAGYPVWTHKHHTDLAYLACARRLLATQGRLYPQFATHNAGTLAAVLRLGEGTPFELQRLHGMGEAVYREVQKQMASSQPSPLTPAPVRVYAPVGRHRDLLAYLVRRLLENGANSSFVHRLADDSVDTEALLAAPWASHSPGLPAPSQLYGPGRRNARGLDLATTADRGEIETALAQHRGAAPAHTDCTGQAGLGMNALAQAFPGWAATPLAERTAILRRAADALEQALPRFTALLIDEGRKTWGDAVAEVREAIDFCRYYAAQADHQLAPQALPGPTGEHNELRCTGRGVFVCISPWNFPLAIFTGQVVAALVAGNTVAAKPAEQTPATAQAMVALLHAAGVPHGALQLFCGPGDTIGEALVTHPACAGVAFTGSTAVAKHIQRRLAASDGPIVPLIAETGGLNAMIVDSSALPEQVIDAVVQSAFRSAGQRCSALRLLCVHEAIADALITLLGGAMQTLVMGEPRQWSTDVGPVIDGDAHANLTRHVQRLESEARLLARTPMDERLAATHIAPVAFEIDRVAALREEIFGPVLHVVRWHGAVEPLVDEINALGYGLTLGVQTRIDGRADAIARRSRVGNVYINRNTIGAVVGVQPFGGMGLSGTGPKAGGPHYLQRFCQEQTVSVNTAAAGGNVALMTRQ